ncbi:DNA-3-methyladenine glycosylase I [Lactobacillaceae bacterium L1_55_11]|nr:DNA-3-methyladenine glycosylase I [Lactobacillaceae bacterium L1_55_11]
MVERCYWAENLPADDPMVIYHDQEWGRPTHDGQKLFELLTLEAFQAGLSWRTVLNKRAAFRAAFANFDVNQVAKYGPEQVERLMNDAGIIRNRRKIAATIHNAQVIMAMPGGLADFSRLIRESVDDQPVVRQVGPVEKLPPQTPESVQLSKTLKQNGFAFVGPVTVESFMQAAGLVRAHTQACFLN